MKDVKEQIRALAERLERATVEQKDTLSEADLQTSMELVQKLRDSKEYLDVSARVLPGHERALDLYIKVATPDGSCADISKVRAHMLRLGYAVNMVLAKFSANKPTIAEYTAEYLVLSLAQVEEKTPEARPAVKFVSGQDVKELRKELVQALRDNGNFTKVSTWSLPNSSLSNMFIHLEGSDKDLLESTYVIEYLHKVGFVVRLSRIGPCGGLSATYRVMAISKVSGAHPTRHPVNQLVDVAKAPTTNPGVDLSLRDPLIDALRNQSGRWKSVKQRVDRRNGKKLYISLESKLPRPTSAPTAAELAKELRDLGYDIALYETSRTNTGSYQTINYRVTRLNKVQNDFVVGKPETSQQAISAGFLSMGELLKSLSVADAYTLPKTRSLAEAQVVIDFGTAEPTARLIGLEAIADIRKVIADHKLVRIQVIDSGAMVKRTLSIPAYVKEAIDSQQEVTKQGSKWSVKHVAGMTLIKSSDKPWDIVV